MGAVEVTNSQDFSCTGVLLLSITVVLKDTVKGNMKGNLAALLEKVCCKVHKKSETLNRILSSKMFVELLTKRYRAWSPVCFQPGIVTNWKAVSVSRRFYTKPKQDCLV